MPHLKEGKRTEPLWKEWDQKAQKKGIRNTVYSVNRDEYTGEWLENKRHGKNIWIASTVLKILMFFLIIAHVNKEGNCLSNVQINGVGPINLQGISEDEVKLQIRSIQIKYTIKQRGRCTRDVHLFKSGR